MARKTLQQGLSQLKRMLNKMHNIPIGAIEAGHRVIMSDMPVLTGAYREAVQVVHGSERSAVFITEGALVAANAPDSSRVYEDWHSGGDSYHGTIDVGIPGPYPLRIEALASPGQGMGQGIWDEAKYVVGETIARALDGASA